MLTYVMDLWTYVMVMLACKQLAQLALSYEK